MCSPPPHRLSLLQTIIWTSLSVVVGFGLLIRFRPMPAEDLALSLLCGIGAFMVFGAAVIATVIEPTLVEIRLRLRQLELHQQLTADEAQLRHLRTAMQPFMRSPRGSTVPSDRAGGRSPVYVLRDPDEPEEALPVGADTRSLSTSTSI